MPAKHQRLLKYFQIVLLLLTPWRHLAFGQYQITSWNRTADLPTAEACAAVAFGNHIIVIGPTGLVYVGDADPASGQILSWRPTISFPGLLTTYRPAIVGNYVVMPGSPSYIGELASDGSVISWQPGAATVQPVDHDLGVTVDGSRIYAVAGSAGPSLSQNVQYATIDNNGVLSQWTPTTELPIGIDNPMVATINGFLYVFGGLRGDGGTDISRDVRRAPIFADGSVGGWEFVGYLKTARPNANYIRGNGTIHVIGGGVNDSYTNSVESALEAHLGEIDPIDSVPLPNILSAMGTAVIGLHGYVIAGNDTTFGTHVTQAVYYASLGTYDFGGFVQPVDNPPTNNLAKAGQSIPVKWQLRDGSGNFISDLSSFKSLVSSAVACDSAPSDIVGETVTATGSTLLRFDATTNQFVYNWQTDKTWNGCRLLQLTLNDGSTHFAKFRFK
jgi:hypothetical protein